MANYGNQVIIAVHFLYMANYGNQVIIAVYFINSNHITETELIW
jgi:hypothetical protein